MFRALFDLLIDPFDKEAVVAKAEADFARVKVPAYTGSGWYGYTYKTHLNGAQSWYANIDVPKKLMLDRPGASRAAVPFISFRIAALVRPLAQRPRHRHDGRAAGEVLGDGRERMALRPTTGRCRRRNGPSSI